jgi:hypothetical protein
VHLEASTKPHVHRKFEISWTNIASTMACPMSKNGPKKGLRPLGVKLLSILLFNELHSQELLDKIIANSETTRLVVGVIDQLITMLLSFSVNHSIRILQDYVGGI